MYYILIGNITLVLHPRVQNFLQGRGEGGGGEGGRGQVPRHGFVCMTDFLWDIKKKDYLTPIN